jgi:hypothetical protein
MSPSAAPKPARPPLRHLAWILALCVGLGATGVVFGLSAVLSWNEPLSMATLPVPEAPAGEEAAWAPVREAFERVPGLQLSVIKRHRAGLTALAAVDLIASAVLLVGGLVVRRRTASSLRLLNTGLVLSQAYAALKLGIQTWVQVDLYRALSPILRDLARQGEAGATTAQVTLFAQSATIVVMAVVALAELLFYAYAQRYLRRPDVARFLAGGPAPQA